MSDPEWKQFEKAVTQFHGALESDAKIVHNEKVPDIHTGRGRQRDIWIEKKLYNGLYTMKILVSCKDWKTKLSSDDIDAFNGEFISSGANLGIIYSYSGFSDPAIEKAKKLGFPCCKLYEDLPPDIPEVLLLKSYICQLSNIRINLSEKPNQSWGYEKVGDILAVDNVSEKLLSYFIRYIKEAVKTASEKKAFPERYTVCSINFNDENSSKNKFTLSLVGEWIIYSGRPECHLVNGAYSFTDNKFIGKQHGPAFEISAKPEDKEGWQQLDYPQKKPKTSYMIGYLYANDYEEYKETLDNIISKEVIEDIFK